MSSDISYETLSIKIKPSYFWYFCLIQWHCFLWKTRIFIIQTLGRGVKWPGSRDKGQFTAGQLPPLPSNKYRFKWKHHRPTATSVPEENYWSWATVFPLFNAVFEKRCVLSSHYVLLLSLLPSLSALGDKPLIRLFIASHLFSWPRVFPPSFSIQPSHHIFPKVQLWPPGQELPWLTKQGPNTWAWPCRPSAFCSFLLCSFCSSQFHQQLLWERTLLF